MRRWMWQPSWWHCLRGQHTAGVDWGCWSPTQTPRNRTLARGRRRDCCTRSGMPTPSVNTDTNMERHKQTDRQTHLEQDFNRPSGHYWTDTLTFDAHCCHMGTAIKHPVSDWVKPSFVIFDIRVLWRLAVSVRVPGCQKLQMTTA